MDRWVHHTASVESHIIVVAVTEAVFRHARPTYITLCDPHHSDLLPNQSPSHVTAHRHHHCTGQIELEVSAPTFGKSPRWIILLELDLLQQRSHKCGRVTSDTNDTRR